MDGHGAVIPTIVRGSWNLRRDGERRRLVHAYWDGNLCPVACAINDNASHPLIRAFARHERIVGARRNAAYVVGTRKMNLDVGAIPAESVWRRLGGGGNRRLDVVVRDLDSGRSAGQAISRLADDENLQRIQLIVVKRC